MVLAACRTLGPIVPMAAGRAGTRGAGRTQRGRGGGGGSSRGGAGGGRGGRGRAPPSRGEAAGQTGGVGAPSPRWGWDQRADAASEARRGVSTSRGPSRDALSPGNGDVASSSVSSGDAPQRVSKLMAWRGLCSRREAEELISRGVVTVEGAVAKQGDKALSDARIEIADAAGARWLRAKVTVVLNKPVGWVSNLPGPGEREAFELVTARNAASESDRLGVLDALRESASDDANGAHEAELRAELRGLKLNVCGRLDKDSRGLLVLTQDGVLARAVIGGNEIPKVYVVRLDRPVTDEHISKLNGPVSLEGERLLPMKVERLYGERKKDALRFTLREGKNRQIRRVCDAAGLRVVDLERVRVGGCELGDLPEGAWRLMTEAERESLRAAGGAGVKVHRRGRGGGGGGSRGRRRI